MLSHYQLEILSENKTPHLTSEKLVLTLYDKKDYTCHYLT